MPLSTPHDPRRFTDADARRYRDSRTARDRSRQAADLRISVRELHRRYAAWRTSRARRD